MLIHPWGGQWKCVWPQGGHTKDVCVLGVANMRTHIMLRGSLVVELFGQGGLRCCSGAGLIGLCGRNQRTPAKKVATSGGHNFLGIASRMLCFEYVVDEYVFYKIKKRAPGYVACGPSNRRNAGPPLAAASRRTRSKHMPDLRVTYLPKYWS